MPGTIGDALMASLAARRVRHIFGVPGGDCNLDLIDSAERVGIRFVLTRTESAAAIMAMASSMISGAPGVVMTTRGPGLANAANGIACATLDRVPLLVIADAYEEELEHISHQRFDQRALLAPVTKASTRLDSDDPMGEFEALLDLAQAQPPGAVYLEVTGKRVRTPPPATRPVPAAAAVPPPDPQALETIRGLLAKSSKPLVIAGVQANDRAAAEALRELAEQWACPVLTTYMAKGVVPETEPYALGHFIGGAAENDVVQAADLILLYGFDPIEMTPQKWRWPAPVVEITRHVFERPWMTPAVSLVGDLATLGCAVGRMKQGSDWTGMAETQAAIRARADAREGGPISPQALVEAAMSAAPAGARITVDAGAHMLPVVHLWRAEEPRQSMISRGLATMGYALPSAIGAAITEPDRPVVAFTGDGGLMMCAGELGTAVQNMLKLVVVVFNDAGLTLIAAKQRRRNFKGAGVDFSRTNFADIARGFGCAAYRVERPEDLAPAMAAAFACDGPALVDVVVDPTAYDKEIIAIRG